MVRAFAGATGFAAESSKFTRSSVAAPDGAMLRPVGAPVSERAVPLRNRPVMVPATLKLSVANFACSAAVIETDVITGDRSSCVTKWPFTEASRRRRSVQGELRTLFGLE